VYEHPDPSDIAHADEHLKPLLTYHFESQTQLPRESLLLYVQEETARREQIAHDLTREEPGVERVAEAAAQLAAMPARARASGMSLFSAPACA
jgi:hypothetical protein